MNVIRPSVPCPVSKLGSHPSQPLSPFQLAPGTRALGTHKGTGELASSVPALGPSHGANWAEKAGRARAPSPRAAEGGQVFGRQRRVGRASGDRSFLLSISLLTGQTCTEVKGSPQPTLSLWESELLVLPLSYPPFSTAPGRTT